MITLKSAFIILDYKNLKTELSNYFKDFVEKGKVELVNTITEYHLQCVVF